MLQTDTFGCREGGVAQLLPIHRVGFASTLSSLSTRVGGREGGSGDEVVLRGGDLLLLPITVVVAADGGHRSTPLVPRRGWVDSPALLAGFACYG